jgi:hypothetical protein
MSKLQISSLYNIFNLFHSFNKNKIFEKKKMTLGVDVIKAFFFVTDGGQNKLECLYLETLSGSYLRIRLEPYIV